MPSNEKKSKDKNPNFFHDETPFFAFSMARKLSSMRKMEAKSIDKS